MAMKPIIVTAATPLELSILKESLEGGGRILSGNREVREGTIAGKAVILAVTGIGKVNTASAVTALLEHHDAEILINTGCAGAYAGSGLAVGDLAMASEELFGDEGVLTPQGWSSMELIGIPCLSRKGIDYYNRFPLTRWARDKAANVAEMSGFYLHQGGFVTVSTASGTAQRGEELYRRFGALCENMEGAAAAQIAALYGMDFLEVRGISNLVEDRDLSRWEIPLAVGRAQDFILKFISALVRI
jgi:futalosine hydrolase